MIFDLISRIYHLTKSFWATPLTSFSLISKFLFINCWSLLVLLVYSCLCIAMFFSPKIRRQGQGRLRKFLAFILRGKHKTGTWVFFCSSAGEYEQAVPLLEKLAGERVDMLILFFSQSGYRFAQLRHERAQCLLAPPDMLWLWWWFFGRWRPRGVIVVRHELWPAFLYAAASRSKLYLVNASFPHLRHRWLNSWLLCFFAKIFVVSEADRVVAQGALCVPDSKMVVAGDSKYDRVMQRVGRQEVDDVRFALLHEHGKRRRLLLGSAWGEEVVAVLDIYRQWRSGWQVVIAPHEPSAAMVAWIEELCWQRKFSVRRYGQLSLAFIDVDVIIVDMVGYLTELYGLAELALVGGGMRGKVHNVLEPVFHGVPTAMGRYYTNSREAELLLKEGWLTVVDKHSVGVWWREQADVGRAWRAQQLAFVQGLCGATDVICAELGEDC